VPCAVGLPRGVSGLTAVTEGPEFSACVGLLHYAMMAAESTAPAGGLGQWLKGLFGR